MNEHTDIEQGSAVLNRRAVLGFGLAATATMLMPFDALAANVMGPTRSLSLINLHTGERFNDEYWVKGRYDPNALRTINRVLRDHRTGDVHPIDLRLIELIALVHRTLRTRAPFHVVSGYRSPRTNAMLRAQSDGVARNSFHMKGKAIDLRLPGTDTRLIRTVGTKLQVGGVGYYPRSDFVHLDVGPFRTWGVVPAERKKRG